MNVRSRFWRAFPGVAYGGCLGLFSAAALARPGGEIGQVCLGMLTVAASLAALLLVQRSVRAWKRAGASTSPIDDRDLHRARHRDLQFRLLAENTSELVILAHNDGRRSYISPAATRLVGFTPEELAAMRLRACVHPDDLQRFYDTTLQLHDGKAEVAIDFRARHKNGGWVWVEGVFRHVTVRRTDGGPTIVATFRSIEERLVHAAELEHAKEAAEAAARIKSDFLANMSHELRTPLTSLLGVCDLLGSDWSLSAPQRRLLNLATDSGRVLLGVVNDVLDFSLIEAGQLKLERVAVDLRALMDGLVAMVNDKVHDKRLTLSITFATDVPRTVVGDPARLRQVLINLVGNAIKFTEAGEVKVGVALVDGQQTLRAEITDTGIGIAAEALPNLFDRFTQADTSVARRYGGSGLGLAICRKILTLMDGTIGAVSTPGHGSTFWFEVPLLRAEALEVAPRAAAAPGSRELRLLLAEDNPINREIIAAALRKRGHEIVMVEDGRAAYEAFVLQPFDAVLMDIQMPGTDGLAATALIREHESRSRQKPTPIVALTANAFSAETERYLRAGMDAHVAKPVVWAQLFQVLDSLAAQGPAVDAPSSCLAKAG